MIKYEFSEKFIERFREFLSSECFGNDNAYPSDYWKHYVNESNIDISGNTITASGKSGCYVSQRKGPIKKLKSRVFKAINNPSLLISFIKQRIGISVLRSEIKLLNYFDAFEKVMNPGPMVDPEFVDSDLFVNQDLFPYRINFRKVKKQPGSVTSIQDLQQNYFAKDKYELNSQTINSYYVYNILNAYTDITRTRTILDIGAGNGNLLSILYKFTNNTNFVDVDLPETLSLAILYIQDLFPDARLLMPHEINSYNLDNYDFIFLTPEQIHTIEDSSIDLAINRSSFQEMTHKQIEEYFQLIQRCVKDGSYFFTCNRVDKFPYCPDSCGKEASILPNRFSEYPWNPVNKTLIYEICRLTRLTQLDNMYIRLEQIRY